MISLLRKPGEALVLAFACGLAALHAVLAVTATAEKSMTSDEIAHLTAGHAYNTRGDFRLQPENGNLPQRLAALPHVLAGDPLPPTDRVEWKGSDVWRYGHGERQRGEALRKVSVLRLQPEVAAGVVGVP
ncbi:MAG: hypothetical protein ACKOTE_09630, partial [Opitutaceae bacterium]